MIPPGWLIIHTEVLLEVLIRYAYLKGVYLYGIASQRDMHVDWWLILRTEI
jgi:hypothetical protein